MRKFLNNTGIILLNFVILFSFTFPAFANEVGEWENESVEHNYKVTLPSEWEQIDEDYISIFFEDSAVEAVGFHLKNTENDDLPFLFIMTEKEKENISNLYTEVFEEYKKDPIVTKDDYIKLIKVLYLKEVWM